MIEHAKVLGDTASIATVLATLVGWLPGTAALLTLVWTGLRIYQTALEVKRLRKKG